MKPTLLIVDDDEGIRSQMKWALAEEYEILQAEDRVGTLKAFRTSAPAAVLLDLGLPPSPQSTDEGFATLAEVLRLDAHAKIIIISGQADRKHALEAVGSGAYDFLCKPVSVDELKMVVRRCLYLAELEQQYRELEQTRHASSFEGMLGQSEQLQQVFAGIRKVAPTPAPVLLLGESGTGKELAAMAIHRHSACKAGPFVPINCSAIPENLIESELFGHEKGAFTGAHQQRTGLIESAAGGTLFLDEIGDLPAPMQVKLLRFLQDRCFHRVGGRAQLHSDARIIAATNANLREATSAGKFREDLFFRLAVVVIELPPLRARGEDVTVVARSFLQRFAQQHQRPGLTFAPAALRALSRYPWPGNIRELQNRVQRAVIMAEGQCIRVADLELQAFDGLATLSLKEARDQADRHSVMEALQRHSGRISSAAAELGISRPTFYELMDRLAIARP
jgi:two-component system NtrC family response regulator